MLQLPYETQNEQLGWSTVFIMSSAWYYIHTQNHPLDVSMEHPYSLFSLIYIPCKLHLVLPCVLDSSKYRCECAQWCSGDTSRSDHSDHIRRRSGPHVSWATLKDLTSSAWVHMKRAVWLSSRCLSVCFDWFHNWTSNWNIPRLLLEITQFWDLLSKDKRNKLSKTATANS